MALTVGDPAPKFSDTDYSGKWVLLYFYPKDFTSGCTTEACSFRDHFSELSQKLTVIGVSADSADSHTKFKDQYQLPFELIADPDRQLIKAYGADGLILAKRTSFLINPTGKIAKIYPQVDPSTHASQILADLAVL